MDRQMKRLIAACFIALASMSAMPSVSGAAPSERSREAWARTHGQEYRPRYHNRHYRHHRVRCHTETVRYWRHGERIVKRHRVCR